MSVVSKSKSKPTTSHICEYCDKEFPKPVALDRHRRVHTSERPFSCNWCDFSAAKQDSLQVHIRGHLREKPFKCREPGCSFSAGQRGTVIAHYKFIHLEEKPFQCPISGCDYKSVTRFNLTQHMKVHEENPEKPFKCELCPYKAKTNGEVKKHLNTVHSDERNFKCSQEGCKFSAKTRGQLNRHVETHGEKTLSCPHPNCEYKSKTKRNLQRHTKIHASEKEHKCRFCEFSAHHLDKLTVHMRIHTKETPYKCKFQGCHYLAKRSSYLNQHVKNVHEKISRFKFLSSDSGCSYAATSKGFEKPPNQNASR